MHQETGLVSIPKVTDLPPDPNVGSGERQMLTEFLDYYRAVIRRKVEGVSDEALKQSISPSTMTLGGLLKHLAFVEDYWFSFRLLGQEPSEPWRSAPWDDDPDWDWSSAATDTGAEIMALYDESVDASRKVQLDTSDLDAQVVQPINGQEDMSYRWVLVHMIEEYARHAGHADLLRERIDGQTGD
ncbi:DinB family protein [Neomicrococcus lactis]|uniref:Putative damage-inducible protein DinB n=1 Tax=Neomicrococcus lactis TaxID=732241 RepID=A0A7W8YAH3_9MICC|nr:DinB family protein [Neomicrococcus lactis]MBB5597887.1 putative damage-inducible protein DinB [Neomicrococcus lactis]